MSVTNYLVLGIRAYTPRGKTAENNPERVLTVAGEFYATTTDANGNLIAKGEALSFASKSFDLAEVNDPAFNLDVKNGILTINAGDKGRTAYDSMDQDEVNSLLDSIRATAE